MKRSENHQIIAWQRLEGFLLLVLSLLVFEMAGGRWLYFALWILAPDLSMLGYLLGPKIGAFFYNAVHSLWIPMLLTIWAVASDFEWPAGYATLVVPVWLAHIGIDRMLGYGLKYDDDFKHTHLGQIGK